MTSARICASCGKEVEAPAAEEAASGAWTCEACGAEHDAANEPAADDPFADFQAASAAQPATARRPTPGPGAAVKQLAGIFGGGIVGLLVGYVILVLIGGPSKNFLNIPFPWLADSEESKAKVVAPAVPTPVKPEPDEPPLAEQMPPPGPAAPLPDEKPTPVPEEESPPEPITSANYVGPREYQGFSVAELRKEVDTFEFRPGEAIEPKLYRRLSHLAEVFTSVELVPVGWSARERRDVVEGLLERVVAGEAATNEVGRLGAAWLDSSHRDGPGIAVAGMLEDVRMEGRVARSRLMLFGKPQPLDVISRTRPAWQPPTPLLILGMIIDDPVKDLAGYEGPPGRVVWASMFINRGTTP